jgi:hypothetical protein
MKTITIEIFLLSKNISCEIIGLIARGSMVKCQFIIFFKKNIVGGKIDMFLIMF